jgi:anti-sigma-K factor RskA
LNIDEYISSGIIESYILGELSDSECAAVKAMSIKHPAVQLEIERIETTLMNYNATTPPLDLKNKILSQIELQTPKVVSFEKKKAVSFFWLAAASIVLLVMSGFYILSMMSQLKTAEEQLVALSAEKEKVVKEYESQTVSYQSMAKQMSIVLPPENKKIILKGMDISPKAMAAIYWNTSTNEVYLNISALPKPPDNQQYQLWAIVDGKPVSEGVFDMLPNDGMHQMKSIATAQAFAVTLEKIGGSAAPTMTAMYLMGNV